jgi:hypothetical protein
MINWLRHVAYREAMQTELSQEGVQYGKDIKESVMPGRDEVIPRALLKSRGSIQEARERMLCVLSLC